MLCREGDRIERAGCCSGALKLNLMFCDLLPQVVAQRPVSRDLPVPAPTASIYERIGGHEPIEATLLKFHKKGLNHPQVQRWFEDVPDTIGSGQLRSFMIIAFGGPNLEEALSLKNAYESTVDTDLSSQDFEIMLDIFTESMEVSLSD